jgi:hypothetical protein
MLRNKLVRSDGSIIDSSVIISCEYSEEVNSDNNLIVGDVTSSELIVEILSTARVEQDEMLTYYIIEDDVETLIGQFKVEKPTIASRTSIKFSAYDNIVKLERLFSDWLILNQSLFPMTLLDLVQYACSYCGVTLASTDFPRADMPVNAFYSDGLTSRQILSWAGAIAGRFIRANANGEIEFAWYTEVDGIICTPGTASFWEQFEITVTDDGEGNVFLQGDSIEFSDDGDGNVSVVIPGTAVLNSDGDVSVIPNNVVPYFQNGITYESYATDFIERVRINHSDSDVGVVFPADATGNCFTLSGNAILATCDLATVSTVAAGIYNTLRTVSYTPAKIHVPRTIKVRAGDIVRLNVPSGEVLTTYAMRVSINSSGTNIESTGDKSYNTNAAVSSQTYSNMAGRMLAVTQTAEGVEVKNTDLEGRVTRLGATVQGLETTVLQTMTDLDDLRGDTATQFTSTVQTAKEMVDTVLEEYVTSDEFGRYKSSVSTQFTQTSDEFKMQFDSAKTEIDHVNEDLQQKYEERTRYIRFVDGDIILGSTDSEIMLIIKNDRISFVRNVSGLPEVAWFADDVLNVTEGQFTTQLNIGKFGFRPGASGNLSFKKVVN